jgi:Leucine-rich repeat (LRR) protein
MRQTTTSLDRSSSDQSTGSLLYGKTPTSGALLGKSSSLIFPTGIDSTPEDNSEAAKIKRRKVNLALDQCEAVRFPFKKKLILTSLELSAADIPLKDLCGSSLGNSLFKLSLAGNRLGTVPPKLVQSLPLLKHLDLSQCELSQLPDKWNLPKLARLNLSHNGFTEFPEEVCGR